MMQSDKAQLRQEVRRRVAGLSLQQRREAASRVAMLLRADPLYRQSRHVMAYWALPDELDLSEFVGSESAEKQFYLPVVDGDCLRVAPLTGHWREGAYHIQEPDGAEFADPAVLDYVIVPGRAFDASGNRMGRGKGFYDRFLASISACKTGVCFACQIFDQVPVGPEDVVMRQVFFA